jgi:hypothetical protein
MTTTNFSLPTSTRTNVGRSAPVKAQGISGYSPSFKLSPTKIDSFSLTFTGEKETPEEKAKRIRERALRHAEERRAKKDLSLLDIAKYHYDALRPLSSATKKALAAINNDDQNKDR